jgi:Domain of unknown function (DUF4260)
MSSDLLRDALLPFSSSCSFNRHVYKPIPTPTVALGPIILSALSGPGHILGRGALLPRSKSRRPVTLLKQARRGTILLLFLVPDLSMLGYLSGPQTGAVTYNLFHTYVLPGLLAALGLLTGSTLLVSLALVWFAHIGFDRMVGYGLKYPTGFFDTHLHHL